MENILRDTHQSESHDQCEGQPRDDNACPPVIFALDEHEQSDIRHAVIVLVQIADAIEKVPVCIHVCVAA